MAPARAAPRSAAVDPRVGLAFAAALLGGCVAEEECVRPDPPPQIRLSAIEAAPDCQPIGAVEVRAGERDPTPHEQLREYAAERGANYVVLDAFGAVPTGDDIVAVTRARLFRCPIALTWYQHPR
jgi:hypothetical protein